MALWASTKEANHIDRWDAEAAGQPVTITGGKHAVVGGPCRFCGRPLDPVGVDLWGCYRSNHPQNASNDSCPRRLSHEPPNGFLAWPSAYALRHVQVAAQAIHATVLPNNGCERFHVDPHEFEERSAIISERFQEAFALARKHGHFAEDNRPWVFFNVFSEQPQSYTCPDCQEKVVIEQKRHLPPGAESFKGPILYFDCARLQRKAS